MQQESYLFISRIFHSALNTAEQKVHNENVYQLEVYSVDYESILLPGKVILQLNTIVCRWEIAEHIEYFMKEGNILSRKSRNEIGIINRYNDYRNCLIRPEDTFEAYIKCILIFCKD